MLTTLRPASESVDFFNGVRGLDNATGTVRKGYISPFGPSWLTQLIVFLDGFHFKIRGLGWGERNADRLARLAICGARFWFP